MTERKTENGSANGNRKTNQKKVRTRFLRGGYLQQEWKKHPGVAENEMKNGRASGRKRIGEENK